MAENRLSVGFNAEGPLAEVNRVGIRLKQVCPPPDSLSFHQIHEIRAQDSIWKSGVVLHVGGGHELASRDATSLESGDQQRLQVGACGVDGRGVPGRAGSDDHNVFYLLQTFSRHLLSGMIMDKF